MKITRQEVEQVAGLARLELRPEEIDRMTAQLDTILGYVAKLDELDTAGVAPVDADARVRTPFREDVVAKSLDREKALANAPADDGQSFVVPRVIT